MYTNLSKLSYTLNDTEFKAFLNDLKSNADFKFFEGYETPYYFILDSDVSKALLKLNKAQNDLDYVYSSLTNNQQEMIIKSCLLEEIQATNKTENIFSTKHDIFELLNKSSLVKNKRIISIANTYNLLSSKDYPIVSDLEDLRELYELMMNDAYNSKDDYLDGDLFRKDIVSVSDGLKSVHHGFYPEDKIKQGLGEYLELMNNDNTDLYLRVILGHFLIETIHPFYDGNGRFGRVLMSLKIASETNSIVALRLASAINKQKSTYYKTLSDARSFHSYGVLNNYVVEMANLINDEISLFLNELKAKNEYYLKCLELVNNYSFTKSETLVFNYLIMASIYTYFGVSCSDLVETLKISLRTVKSTIKKFKELGLLKSIKCGHTNYYKLSIIEWEFEE